MFNVNDKISYTGKDGLHRTLRAVKVTDYMVAYSKELPPSIATVWELENGQRVQIPNNSWEFFGINYVLSKGE